MNKNYITAKQFLEQSKEVQDVFLSWWKPQHRELVQGCYYGNEYDRERIWCIGDVDMNYVKNKLKPTPLFTETKLRRFIEYFSFGSMTFMECLYYYNSDNDYGYEIKPTVSDSVFYSYKTNKQDLLEAYWVVACKIAEVIIKNKKEKA